MIWKVCGMREEGNIRALAELGPTWMGFIFYEKSPRHVSQFPHINDLTIKKIGVFVDANITFIEEKIHECGLDGVQLHGEESPEKCKIFMRDDFLVVKAFSVGNDYSFEQADAYDGHCNYFLFDTKGPSPGGTGLRFDWNLLKSYRGDTGFILSGGLGPDDVSALRVFSHPQWEGVDVNSRFELRPGLKDIDLLSNFKDELFS